MAQSSRIPRVVRDDDLLLCLKLPSPGDDKADGFDTEVEHDGFLKLPARNFTRSAPLRSRTILRVSRAGGTYPGKTGCLPPYQH